MPGHASIVERHQGLQVNQGLALITIMPPSRFNIGNVAGRTLTEPELAIRAWHDDKSLLDEGRQAKILEVEIRKQGPHLDARWQVGINLEKAAADVKGGETLLVPAG